MELTVVEIIDLHLGDALVIRSSIAKTCGDDKLISAVSVHIGCDQINDNECIKAEGKEPLISKKRAGGNE